MITVPAGTAWAKFSVMDVVVPFSLAEFVVSSAGVPTGLRAPMALLALAAIPPVTLMAFSIVEIGAGVGPVIKVAFKVWSVVTAVTDTVAVPAAFRVVVVGVPLFIL